VLCKRASAFCLLQQGPTLLISVSAQQYAHLLRAVRRRHYSTTLAALFVATASLHYRCVNLSLMWYNSSSKYYNTASALTPLTLPTATEHLYYVLSYLYAGIMGFVAFQKVGDQSFFSDVGESIWSLMQLLTTVNFPDVMVKQYDASRFTILFFFVFCGLGIFFLVSVH
jgi:Ion transport protein